MNRAVVTFALALGLLWTSGFSQAQEALCGPAFESAVTGIPESDMSRIATAVARAAYEALEPATPARRATRDLSDRNARWMDERGLLPEPWDEDRLTGDVWTSLLASLQTPYGLNARRFDAPETPEAAVRDAQTALARGAREVRPLGLIATASNDRERVSFTAVIWNWTPHPRLLIFRDTLRSLADGPEAVAASIGTCAWSPQHYLLGDEASVRNYYLGNVDTEMIILATDRSGRVQAVPRAEQVNVLALTAPQTRDADVVAVGFAGPGPAVTEVVGLLTTVRTNIGLLDIPRYLAIPNP